MQPQWLADKANGLKINRATRVKNRRPRTRKKAAQEWLRPDHMRVAAEFHDFAQRCHAVYIGNTIPTPSNHDLLTYLQSLDKPILKSLITDFINEETPEASTYLPLFHGETIGTNLSRQSMLIQTSMYQIALGNKNVCTHSLRFGDDFLSRVSQRKHESITEVINKEVKKSLAQIWKERGLHTFLPLPAFWHVLDYTDDDPQDRGPGGFHIHGEIVAGDAELKYIREAMELASNGYKRIWDNKIVHFGEPVNDFSNRGGDRRNCLSDYPGAVRASGDDYHFYQPWYASQKIDRAQAAGEALGVNIGKGWGRSPGLLKEATACLGIFKILLDNLPG